MTQTEKVLTHLQKYGSITPLEALQEYGIMRLASRISDLKHDGYKVSKKIVSRRNRAGETVRFAEYSLEVEKDA